MNMDKAPVMREDDVTKQDKAKTNAMCILDKHFEVYLDASGAELDELFINGGQRGINLRLRVADLLAVTGARVIRATAEHPG